MTEQEFWSMGSETSTSPTITEDDFWSMGEGVAVEEPPDTAGASTWEDFGVDRSQMAAGPEAYDFNLKRAADWEQEARGPITGSAPYQILEGAVKAGASAIVDPLLAAENALGFETAGDMLSNRQAQRDIRSMRDQSWIERQASGIAESVGQMGALALTGGAAGLAGKLPAIIGGSMFQSYAQSERQSLKEGKTQEEATTIARANASLEGGITAIFQLAGLGGAEQAFLKSAGWQGIKRFLGATAAELGEEELITITQELASRGEISPQALIDTAAQTIGTMGLIGGAQKLREFIANPSRETAQAAGITTELAPEQADLEHIAEAVKEQIASEAPSTLQDASPENTTADPYLVPEASQDAAGEAARALEEVVSEQPSSDLSTIADKSYPDSQGLLSPPDAPSASVSPSAPADSGVAEPPFPLWEYRHSELEEMHESAREQDKSLLQRLFGVEGAKKYQALRRRANNVMDPQGADKASKESAEMEDALTEAQQDELYGIGLTDDRIPEAIQPYLRAMGAIDDSSAEELGRSIGYQLTQIGEEADPLKMRESERVALAVMREAYEIAGERGFDLQAVQNAAIRRAVGRFSDPDDALFMLRRFLPKEAAQPDADPAPSPKRLAAPTALAEINLDALPAGLSVKVDAIRAKTGERVKTKQDAREAIAELDDSISLYKKLIACIGDG